MKMTHLHLTYRHSASRQDEAMEACFSFGSEDLAPPPTAPCVREVSWGSQSVSMLLMGGGGETGGGSSATAPSSDVHIFMDSSDRDPFWHPSQTNLSGKFTNELARILHECTHPTNRRSESRLAPSNSGCSPPPLPLTSSTSIEILHTGRSSRSIVSDLLWEDSFNSAAMDGPLACYRDGCRTHPRSTLAAFQEDSAVTSLQDAMATNPSQELDSSTSTCSESSSSDDDSDDTGPLWGEPNGGSSFRPRNRDVAPRMPSRRRRLSEDST
jgi:hypothetical protein